MRKAKRAVTGIQQISRRCKPLLQLTSTGSLGLGPKMPSVTSRPATDRLLSDAPTVAFDCALQVCSQLLPSTCTATTIFRRRIALG